MRCPVCNGPVIPLSPWTTNNYLVCRHCSEILLPRELVEVATRVTRRKFARENGHDNSYGTNVPRYQEPVS